LLEERPHAFGGKSFEEQICNNLSLPMDEQVRNRIVQFLEDNSMFPRILKWESQSLFENACVSPCYGPLSNLFIPEIPSAFSAYL
jgi:hypothetical protein